jgi:apolipoprotein N-acyltransferase
MQRVKSGPSRWRLWAAAGLSAGLLELPFPLAGPLPPWRSIFAWFGLVPLLWAILSSHEEDGSKPLRQAFLLSYVCGVLWYAGNCYWVRDTMQKYGDMPPLAPELLLLGFSLVLGTYFGLFGLAIALVRKATGSNGIALACAPAFWAGLELAASRITSVPWDQLGYSQVDNALVNQLAPWTGVYGISFLLVAVNALIAGGLTLKSNVQKGIYGTAGIVATIAGMAGLLYQPPRPATSATAVLIQPNLDVGGSNMWTDAAEWNQHIARFAMLGNKQCKTYIAGIPQTGAPSGEVVCPPYVTHPDLVAWPESPAPFFEGDIRFQNAAKGIAQVMEAPVVIGSIGMDYHPEAGWSEFNSAIVMSPAGARVGRYDKIHLVPFGEYVPFSRLLFFARKLTGKVSKFDRGEDRKVFRLSTQSDPSHRYGVFICYEAVFADEVRQFAQLGAEVLVNISDDGWYGDTSAPWQHLNMARMRAIENRRWILRDTNNGVTAAIDPYGRVRQSIPRHVEDALPAQYGFRDDTTFYTEHGDVFGWACAILGLVAAGWAGRRNLSESLRRKV